MNTIKTSALLLTAALTACGSSDRDGDGLSNAEEKILGTSPDLADTDGDGIDDYREVVELGFDAEQAPYRFNPLIADVPRISFELTSIPAIELITTESESYGISETSESANSYSTSQTDSHTHSVEMTHTAGASVNQEFGYGPLSFGSTSVELSYEFSHSTSNETSVSFGTESTEEMRRALEESRLSTTTMEGGRLAVIANVVNEGNLAFTMTGFSLSALQRDRAAQAAFRPVSTLEPESLFDFPERTLGPGQAMTDVIFSSDSLTVSQAESLLADPNGLVLKISSYELVNEEGVGFSHLNTEIAARTASIIIDYGPERQPERFMVATHGKKGLPVGTALSQVLQLPYECSDIEVSDLATGELVATTEKLTSVRGVAASAAHNAYWIVSTDAKNVADDPLYNFEDIVLKAGDVLHLVYHHDEDGDGLGAREEFLYHSDPALADTDSDGMSDYEEVREGWYVDVYGRNVFSDPTRGGDYDGDGLGDVEERDLGTDPRRADTDDDGIFDDGQTSTFADDAIFYYRLDGDVTDSSGNELHGDAYIQDWTTDRFGFGDKALDLAEWTDGWFHTMIAGPTLHTTGLDFSFAVWVKTGQYNTEDRLLGVDQGAELYFGVDDTIRFGNDDHFVAGPFIGDEVWHFVVGVADYTAATDRTKMSLFVDGQLVGTEFRDGQFSSGCDFQIGNYSKDGDRCHAESDEGRRIDAVVDDVRVYDRRLSALEVIALYQEHGWGE